ncbi:DUF2470 domain-containing protein [Rathayibacter soli]|uniref:DUF2470 domain-containing protein n=1 Tax=Rathayibacter soli TaxID=3144168 RepID=UPI0027E3FCFD|nr:DUF2470 domain-containing protein [Glaciibacter superstes]
MADVSPIRFPPTVVDAVLAHMNTDHEPDNLIIVRAFAQPSATAAIMVGLDAAGGQWAATLPATQHTAAQLPATQHAATQHAATRQTVTIPWPLPVAERADIRRAVTQLYRDACGVLGIEPRVA